MSHNMDAMLKKSAEDGDVNALYSILARDPFIVKHMNEMTVVETPLHIAARVGNTHYAMEIFSLVPSLAWKLNHDGLSPIHLALQNGHDGIVRRMVKIDKQLVHVKAKEGLTPLHLAAQMDNVDILAKFLRICPVAIEDLTVRLETVVHIAIKNNNFRTFKVLLKWVQRMNKEKILKRKDEDGNTAFHIATSTNQPQVMKLLIRYVDVNCKNKNGLTALGIFRLHQPALDGEVGVILDRKIAKRGSAVMFKYCYLFFWKLWNKFLGITGKVENPSSNEVREIVLVVAVLIATASYQAILSPPGGYWQDDSNPSANTTLANTTTSVANTTLANTTTTNIIEQQSRHSAGKMILDTDSLILFFTMNTIAFEISIVTIIVAIIGIPYSALLSLASAFLSYAYAISLVRTFPVQLQDMGKVGISPSTLLPALSFIAPAVSVYVFVFKILKII